MTDLLNSASDWLLDTLKASASVEVTLRRGASATPNLKATIGRTTFEEQQGEEVFHRFESRDYIIQVNDYQIAGVATEPQAGDTFDEVRNGKTYRYQIMSDGFESQWRFSDPFKKAYRIHTKQISGT